jgi:hypothetical protein
MLVAKIDAKNAGIKIYIFLDTNAIMDKGKTKYQGWKVVLMLASKTVVNDKTTAAVKNFSQFIFLPILSINSRRINNGNKAPVENFTPIENILLIQDKVFFFSINK